nr:hypothetical protein BaRGS_021406 [Batillaria attramentaria]
MFGTDLSICENCHNNATCHSKLGFTFCKCPPGFEGSDCQRRVKDGTCPPKNELTDCSHHRSDCFRDSHCEGEQKCCPHACGGRMCADPTKPDEKPVCKYQGKSYDIGTAFSPDPCTVCTCNSSHVTNSSHGIVECTSLLCPVLNSTTCHEIVHDENECCATCKDHGPEGMCGGPYTPPRFLNCPPETVILDVSETSDLARVDLDLRAVDCTGRQLRIYLAEQWVKAGQGEDNFQLLSATSEPDAVGQFTQCLFHVRVRDIHPPEFVTCPSDFSQPVPGPVMWQTPVARDNVGVAIPPISRVHPGDHLGPGSHVILYWTEDYQGNIARCIFVVTVVLVSVMLWRNRRTARVEINRGAPDVRMATVQGNSVSMNVGPASGALPRYTSHRDDVMAPPPFYSGYDQQDDNATASGGQEEAGDTGKSPLPE